MPQAVVAAGIAFVTQAAVSVAIGVVSNFVVSSLFGPDEPEAPTAARRKITSRSSDAARHIVYGRVRKGGTQSFHGVTPGSQTVAFAGSDKFVYHYVVALAGHECDAIEEIWFGDYRLNLDQNGDETGTYAGVMRVKQHLGAWNQTADAELVAAIPETVNFKGRNVCYLYFQLLGDGKFASKQIENVSAVLRGRKIYQPRKPAHSLTDADTWEWSQNTTDCSADLHMGAPIRDAGGNLIKLTGFRSDGARRVDWDKQKIFSQVCDEDVDGQPRFTCNGVISADEDSASQMTKLISSMAGRPINFGGKYAFMPAYARTSVMSFGPDNFMSKPAISLGADAAGLYTAATGLYVDAARSYSSTNSNLVVSASFETTLNGKRRTRELKLPFVDNHTQAERLCKLAVGSSSLQKTFAVLLDFSAIALEVGDVVSISHPDVAGWVNKEFEVTHWVLRIDPKSDANGVMVSLKEYDSDPYLWASGEATDLTTQVDSNIPSVSLVAAPSSVTVDQTNYHSLGALDVTAAAVTHAYPLRYEFRYRAASSATYDYAGPQDSPRLTLGGLVYGEYVVEARAVNSRGVPSNWTPRSFTISNATKIPRPTALRVIDGVDGNEFVGEDVKVDWNDVSFSAEGLQNNDAADTGGMDAKWRGYLLQIYAGTIGSHTQILYEKMVRDSQFALPFDNNRALSVAAGLATAQRNVVFKVYTVMENGQRSDPAVLHAYNNAPPAPLAVASSPLFGSILATLTPVGTDPDRAGAILKYSLTSGFDPNTEGTIGFQDSGPASIVGLATGVTYYLRAAFFDKFGTDQLNWSTEFQVTTASVVIDDASITAAKLAADSVQSTHISDGAIETSHLTAGVIQAGNIATGAVLTDHLSANSVDTLALQANAVTAAKINVNTLAAIKADLGIVYSGRIQNAEIDPTGILDLSGPDAALLIRTP